MFILKATFKSSIGKVEDDDKFNFFATPRKILMWSEGKDILKTLVWFQVLDAKKSKRSILSGLN